MAEPTVFEMEIEGVVHPVEDKTARAGVLVPTLNEGGEITALKDSENVSHDLADTVARQKLEKLQSYSTTEQDTGKTWIDGKKIYRKVIQAYTTDYRVIDTDVLFLTENILEDISTLVNVNGELKFTRSTGYIQKTTFPCTWPQTTNSSYYVASIQQTNSNNFSLVLRAIQDISVTRVDYTIVAEYTKI